MYEQIIYNKYFALALFAFFICYNFAFGTSIDANGNKYFTYAPFTRKVGQYTFHGGFVGYGIVAHLHHEYGYF